MWSAISAETGMAGKEIKLHCHYLIIVIAAMSRRETYNIRSCVGDNVIPSKLASTHKQPSCTVNDCPAHETRTHKLQ